MRSDLLALAPLVCPACRTRTETSRDMHTLELAAVHEESHHEILDGVLRCENPACRRAYPIIDGVPIVVPHLAAVLASDGPALVERDLHPDTAALLALAGPDDASYARMLEHVSIYVDAHWGDRASPPPDGPGPVFGFEAVVAAIAERARDAPVKRTVELGCSVGRAVAAAAAGSAFTVGLDLQPGTVRRARRLLAGERLTYARRIAGRHYRTAAVTPAAPAPGSPHLVCADAHDPPLVPGAFDRVIALNLLDSVCSPPQLLSVLDGLCAPGGEIVIASPFSWQSGIVAEEGRIGGADPAAELERRLAAGEGLEASYAIEDARDLTWWLRRDSRSAVCYSTRLVRARKTAA